MGAFLKGSLLKSPRTYRYTWIAGVMLVVVGVLIVLWLTNVELEVRNGSA